MTKLMPPKQQEALLHHNGVSHRQMDASCPAHQSCPAALHWCLTLVFCLMLSHLEMVLSWFMDFSMNLGKTSVFKYRPQSCAFS